MQPEIFHPTARRRSSIPGTMWLATPITQAGGNAHAQCTGRRRLLPFNEFLRFDRHERLLRVLEALPAEPLGICHLIEASLIENIADLRRPRK